MRDEIFNFSRISDIHQISCAMAGSQIEIKAPLALVQVLMFSEIGEKCKNHLSGKKIPNNRQEQTRPSFG